ncbi:MULTISPECIES: hypothetical protein [Pseudobutyrivibrio]|jgi:hypothetical protein|uniref:Uncharacterized protein n=1 Tax=Pseudobutyrivibrio ruminis DSM 9787 TaxID=1123011 RepID=A0A285T4W8_9FIRM|nr:MULTISPECIES: hypothetical protein [Pseudobutyrivibrio]SES91645.1 hypothetical protein SAMN02910413_1239 [Pseudobutyrivibrio sp. C4]SOC16402.1 hypothetical protein SAMN02910411_0390 [Pseudobutyrivibrio ruminis DSM 9787]
MGDKTWVHKPTGKYFFDDRLNMKLLYEDIAHMTNQEFAAFCKMIEFNGKYPKKYSVTGNWE